MLRAIQYGIPALVIFAVAAITGLPSAALAGSIPLPNPGFELDNNNDGYPDQWVVGFGPVLDKSGAEARSGQSAVKINANARIVTDVAPEPFSALTLRGWMRSNPAGQGGVLQLQQYDGPDFIENTTSQFNLTTSYARYGVNMRPLPGGNRVLALFRGASGQTWSWFDDMDLLTDRIDNGSLEAIENGIPAGWSAVGMPTLDTVGGAAPGSPTAVVCNRNNYFFQPIACSPTTRTYTLEFKVRAAAPIDEGILIKWFDGRGNYFTKSEIAFQAGPEFTRIVHHFSAPPQAVWGEVALQPVESEWLWFDEIYLGWQNVQTPLFTPNDDGINDVPTLYYSLPYDATTTVTLLTDQGGVAGLLAASPAQSAGTNSATIESFFLDFLDEGDYSFRLQVARAGEAAYAMQWPVSLRRIPAWIEQPNAAADSMFAVGIWEYVFGVEFATYSSFADLVGRAAGWNFSAALMLYLKESDFDAAYAALNGSPVQGVTFNFPLAPFVDERRWPDGFDEFGLRDLLLEYTTRFGANPNWLGIYLKDEPFRRDAANLRAAFRVTQNVAPAQLPISTFTVDGQTAFLADQVRPPVLMFDNYTIGAASPLGPEEWTGFLASLDQMRAIARDMARPWWLTTQGFFNSAARRPLVPAEQRGLVGLTVAHGARGIWYFIRSSFGGTEGLLDNEFVETELIREVVAQNARLRNLESILVGLQPDDLAITLDDDQCLAEVYRNSEGLIYIIVVNTNTLIPRSCRLFMPVVIDEMTAGEVRFGPDGRIATPLPAAVDGDEMMISLPPLAPGDWMIVEAGPGMEMKNLKMESRRWP